MTLAADYVWIPSAVPDQRVPALDTLIGWPPVFAAADYKVKYLFTLCGFKDYFRTPPICGVARQNVAVHGWVDGIDMLCRIRQHQMPLTLSVSASWACRPAYNHNFYIEWYAETIRVSMVIWPTWPTLWNLKAEPCVLRCYKVISKREQILRLIINSNKQKQSVHESLMLF